MLSDVLVYEDEQSPLEDVMPEKALDLFEIIATTRSMRRLKPDPVPAELIRKLLEAGVSAPSAGTSPGRFTRMLDAAQYLADHIHEAPVWIVPCMAGASPSRTAGSSIYPAVQNMLLAARALGLGATLTTLYLNFEKEVEAALGLPADVHSYALLPIGYPMGRFGPVRRVPVADIAYEDRWGQPYRDQ